jgi:hypothetical protein
MSLVDLTGRKRGGWTRLDRAQAADDDKQDEEYLVSAIQAGHETCVVNCAVMSTSWPHSGGKRLRKPVVVDLELPIWDGDPRLST